MSRRTEAYTTVEGPEDSRVGGEIAELERLYAAPAAAFEEVEEAADEIIWFVVLIAFLLTLATTVGAAVVVFCWMKGGHLYAWHRISAFKVKIGCKR